MAWTFITRETTQKPDAIEIVLEQGAERMIIELRADSMGRQLADSARKNSTKTTRRMIGGLRAKLFSRAAMYPRRQITS